MFYFVSVYPMRLEMSPFSFPKVSIPERKHLVLRFDRKKLLWDNLKRINILFSVIYQNKINYMQRESLTIWTASWGHRENKEIDIN
jgi:hypothetical protein